MALRLPLPTRANAKAKGWTHQVDWTYERNACFHRAKSLDEAEAWAARNKATFDVPHTIRAIPWEASQ